jgi:hypothetical protein
MKSKLKTCCLFALAAVCGAVFLLGSADTAEAGAKRAARKAEARSYTEGFSQTMTGVEFRVTPPKRDRHNLLQHGVERGSIHERLDKPRGPNVWEQQLPDRQAGYDEGYEAGRRSGGGRRTSLAEDSYGGNYCPDDGGGYYYEAAEPEPEVYEYEHSTESTYEYESNGG